MANEITLTAKLSATKNSVTVTNAVYTKPQTMEGALEHMYHAVQEVGTSEEAVELGDVDITDATGHEYMLLLINRDDTNYVSVKVKYAADPLYWTIGVMLAGESWGPVRLPTLTAASLGGIYLDADTADCAVEVVACEAGNPAA